MKNDINYRTYIKCDNGKIFKVIEYKNGNRIQIPINADGSVKWFDDTKLIRSEK